MSAEQGGVDAVIFPAVLEHMTQAERRASLRPAREVLRPGVVVALFETPNRLLPWDHHTTTTPFFHLLPDDLARSSGCPACAGRTSPTTSSARPTRPSGASC